MLTFLAILHIVIGLGLIIFVLLQDPKGGGAGGMFGGGGGSNTVFGSTGAGNFLTATTKWFAVFFTLSCFALSCMSNNHLNGGSVLDSSDLPGAAEPAAPEATQAVPDKAQPQTTDKEAPAAPVKEAPAQ